MLRPIQTQRFLIHSAQPCFGALLVLLLPLSARAQDKAPVGPVFADGMAQKVEAFGDKSTWIQHDLWVETEFDSDGDGENDRVHVDVTRPGQTEKEGLKVAIVYETSPYFSGTGVTDPNFFWDPKQEVGAVPPKRNPMPSIPFESKRPLMSRGLIDTWVPRGFAVVHSASPGTGLSEGCPTVGGINESLAPKAVIDWLNGRARGFTAADGGEEVRAFWSTGKVAMIGTSYNGTLALAAATTGVAGLEVVVPDAPNTSYYHYYRSNGLVRHPGGYMGEDIDVLYDFINSGDPKRRDWCNKEVRDTLMAEGFDRVRGDYNEFWKSRDYVHALDGVRCAVFLSHGLSDWNVMPEHSVRIYEVLRATGKDAALFLHQGGHGGPPNFEMLNRWFSHYLYGVENGVEKEPRSWIVREDAKKREPTSYADYPHPEAKTVVLYPGLSKNEIGELSLEQPAKQGQEQLVDNVELSGTELFSAEKSRHRLLYATGELKAPLHLSGTPRLKIRVSADREAANLSVWLVALPIDNEKHPDRSVITRGWADPQNQASLSESKPLRPGQAYDLSFDLQPDDQIIPAGKRVALMIFSSDRDYTLWPPAGTKLTVDLTATQLELPVVGGSMSF